MALLNRCRVLWTGYAGSPGYSSFYFDATQTDMAALKTFLNALNGFWPTPVVATIPASGDQINTDTGQIAGVWVGTNGGAVSGLGGSAAYSGASGFLVDWKTGTIINGRRVQGRTYFVPASVNAYQTDGSIIESTRTTVINAANIMIVNYAGTFKIFARPFAGTTAVEGYRPKAARAARPGAGAAVVAAFVPDIAAVMRSRRQ